MSTPIKIQSSNNYQQFLANPLQRTFTERKVDTLKRSMQQYGFWKSCPISVYRKAGGMFVINTGHHRHAAARDLGIPLLYVIEHEYSANELAREGNFSTGWGIKDQAVLHAKQGSPDYVTLVEINSMGIPISLAASMMHGESAGSGNVKERVADGTFEINTREQVDRWIELRIEFPGLASVICCRTFIISYSKCMFTPQFDNEVFKKRLHRNPTMLDKTSNEHQMLNLIEEIYNFGSPNKIPLAFMVTENSRERKKNFGKELQAKG